MERKNQQTPRRGGTFRARDFSRRPPSPIKTGPTVPATRSRVTPQLRIAWCVGRLMEEPSPIRRHLTNAFDQGPKPLPWVRRACSWSRLKAGEIAPNDPTSKQQGSPSRSNASTAVSPGCCGEAFQWTLPSRGLMHCILMYGRIAARTLSQPQSLLPPLSR